MGRLRGVLGVLNVLAEVVEGELGGSGAAATDDDDD